MKPSIFGANSELIPKLEWIKDIMAIFGGDQPAGLVWLVVMKFAQVAMVRNTKGRDFVEKKK